MQPYLFPYVGYFQLIHAVDRFVIYDDVAYIKQGWINRNRILINGEPSFFNVPIKHASSFTLICDTMIDDDRQHARWVEKVLKTFENAYRRAPEFSRVFPIVERVFGLKTTRIAELAAASVKAIASALEIKTGFVDSSKTYNNASLKGEDRVLSICEAERANEYINVPGGRELYSRERFESRGIRLSFIQPRSVQYHQFGGPFVPWLSILDVLMFNSIEKVRQDLDAYDLV